jgi:hypothetical protein
MPRTVSVNHVGAALIALVAASCGGTDGTPATSGTPSPTPVSTPAPPSVEREIAPALTNATVVGSTSPHIAINPHPAVSAKGRLFVMLPGTTAVPRTYQDVVRTGPPRGYHAVGLNYPNDATVVSQCTGSTDIDCNGKARREIITGEDTSPVVSVNYADSIIGRLVALLTYLSSTYPSEGWGQYLFDGQPRWGLITVAGHSQGGSHAAYLAKLVSLDRAVMFSSPGDPGVAAGRPVLWASLPNVTPIERQYGFAHTADTQAMFSVVTTNWAAIGLSRLGAIVSVDGASPPYSGSPQLSTSAAPNPNPTGPSASPTHGATVVDAVTPIDAQGQLLFRPVWIQLAFP